MDASPGTFFGDTNHVLWTSDQTPEGHYEMILSAKAGVTARYVKLSFDGGTPPGGHNKYMLDEIEILKYVPPPVPSLQRTGLMITVILFAVLGGLMVYRRKLV